MTDHEVDDILKANEGMLDAMSIFQHHDAVTGTDNQMVDYDYRLRLAKAMEVSNKQYKKELSEIMFR